jgi:hypothetical protein
MSFGTSIFLSLPVQVDASPDADSAEEGSIMADQ